MKGKNSTTFGIRLPDELYAMVKASAALSEKTVSEYIKDTLAEKYPHWRDRRWEDGDETITRDARGPLITRAEEEHNQGSERNVQEEGQ